MPSAAYDEALQVLYGLSSRGVELGLDRIRRVLVSRGSPHEKLRYVHVAGTNGKGSVAATTASILRASGVGMMYSGPYFISRPEYTASTSSGTSARFVRLAPSKR